MDPHSFLWLKLKRHGVMGAAKFYSSTPPPRERQRGSFQVREEVKT